MGKKKYRIQKAAVFLFTILAGLIVGIGNVRPVLAAETDSGQSAPIAIKQAAIVVRVNYSGGVKHSVTARYQGKMLREGTDYVCKTKPGVKKAGKNYLSVTGINRFQGTVQVPYTVVVNKIDRVRIHPDQETGVWLNWIGRQAPKQGVEIYRKAEKEKTYKKTKVIANASTMRWLDKTAKPGVKYSYRIRAYRGMYYGAFSNTVSARYLPMMNAAPKVTSDKAGTMKIRWKKRKGIAGYQIAYAMDVEMKKSLKKITIADYKKTSTTIRNLKTNRNYFVEMRLIYKTGKKTYYGAWSPQGMTLIRW